MEVGPVSLRHYVSAYKKDRATLLDVTQFSFNLDCDRTTTSYFDALMSNDPLLGNNPPTFKFAKEYHEEADEA